MSSILVRHIAMRLPLVALPAVLIFAFAVQAAEKNTGDASDQAAIRKTANAFCKAFNRADAKAIAALWTENGSLADEGGQVFKGRKAIEDQYAALFKEHPGLRMEIAIQSIEVPAPNVAVEDGLARAVDKDGDFARRESLHRGPCVARRQVADGQRAGVECPDSLQLRTIAGTPVAGRKLGDQVRKRHGPHDDPLDRQQEFPATRIHCSARRRDRLVRRTDHRLGPAGRQGAIVVLRLVGRARHGLWTPTPEGWRIESQGVLADGTPDLGARLRHP